MNILAQPHYCEYVAQRKDEASLDVNVLENEHCDSAVLESNLAPWNILTGNGRRERAGVDAEANHASQSAIPGTRM
uniref:Uncharacterized protein n=1 Tax=Anguilla anguilla TaxID=7936 RepID=A0A0E9VRQ3_ANGAN